MNILYTKEGHIAPPRPSLNNKSDRVTIVGLAVDNFFESNNPLIIPPSAKDGIIDAMISCLREDMWEFDAITKIIEELKSTHPQRFRDIIDEPAFYDDMTHCYFCLDEAMFVALSDWDEQNSIIPPMLTGQHIEEGIIHGIHSYYPATYIVKRWDNLDPKSNKILIPFEKAKASKNTSNIIDFFKYKKSG